MIEEYINGRPQTAFTHLRIGGVGMVTFLGGLEMAKRDAQTHSSYILRG